MNTRIEVLMIGRPSRFRDSIHLLLTSISPIEEISLADDVESALEMKETPIVGVMDSDVGGPCLPAAINKIKTAWPQTGLIILVEDELEFQVALAAGGDVLLRKGFPAAKFTEAVEALLSDQFRRKTHAHF